jgi:hypothetical protein
MLKPPMQSNVASGRFGAKLRDTMWVARHGGLGSATQTYTVKEVFIQIKNLLGNVNYIADAADTLTLALGNRDKMMQQDLAKFIARTAKKNGM